MKNNIKFLNLEDDPYDLFNEWYELAKKNEINDPNAMNLSTVNQNFQPSSRMVLMKFFNKKGFVFNTNMNSKKAKEIINSSKVCLNFYWKSIRKQVRIEGSAEQINKEEADNLFNIRPEESKIGAWASDQSSDLLNRADLEIKVKKYQEKFKDTLIPRPTYWSGFVVVPDLLEFWQDMPFRLHDRLEFKKDKNIWKVKKLYP